MSTDTQEMPAHPESWAQEPRNDGDNARGVADAVVDFDVGDTLRLCGDGLTAVANDDTIADVLRSQYNPSMAADVRIQKALEGGEPDSITIGIATDGST